MARVRQKLSQAPTQVLLFTGETSGCDPLCVDETIDDFENSTSPQFHLQCRPLATVRHSEIQESNVIIMPGGDTWPEVDAPVQSGQYATVRNRQLDETMARMIHQGGIYVGVCGGAFLACYLKVFGIATSIEVVHKDVYGFGKTGLVAGKIQLALSKHAPKPFLSLLKAWVDVPIYYEDGPLMVCKESTNCKVLMTFKGAVKRTKLPRTVSQRKGWKKARSQMKAKAAIVACRVGSGCVILLSPHLELTDALSTNIFPSLIRAAQEWKTMRH